MTRMRRGGGVDVTDAERRNVQSEMSGGHDVLQPMWEANVVPKVGEQNRDLKSLPHSYLNPEP